MMNSNALLILCRVPQLSQVKTRLAVKLGDSITLELYKNFLFDILDVTSSIDADRAVCYTPANAPSKSLELFGKTGLFPQRGDDLGARIFNALRDGFDYGYKRAIVIGADSPDLPASILNEAFMSLEHKDAVIGPSYDGGYYLIGMNAGFLNREIFKKIEWSTDSVYSKTIAKFEKLGIGYTVLDKWYDIDEFPDLEHFYTRNHTAGNKLFTMEYIHEHENIIWRKK